MRVIDGRRRRRLSVNSEYYYENKLYAALTILKCKMENVQQLSIITVLHTITHANKELARAKKKCYKQHEIEIVTAALFSLHLV